MYAVSFLITIIVVISTSHTIQAAEIRESGYSSIDPSLAEGSSLNINVLSIKGRFSVTVNETEVFTGTDRGLNIVILDQITGVLLVNRVYYQNKQLFHKDSIIDFLNSVHDGRILIFASIDDDISQLDDFTKQYLVGIGSKYVKELSSTDIWMMAVQAGVTHLDEIVVKNNGEETLATPAKLSITVPLRVKNIFSDEDSCDMLLNTGRFQEFQEWQPYGCKMHQYSRSEARACFKNRSYMGLNNVLVYIGDSRIRYLFGDLKNFLSNTHETLEKEQNHSYLDTDIGLTSNYIFEPFTNEKFISLFKNLKAEIVPPNMVIAGNALWTIIKYEKKTMEGANNYMNFLREVVGPINELVERKVSVLWTLQEPVIFEKLSAWKWMDTNQNINLYNSAAMKAFEGSKVKLWHSFRHVAQGNLQGCEDGTHHGQVALRQDTQIFLNLYCNKYKHFDDVNTCCSNVSKAANNTVYAQQIELARNAMLSHNHKSIELTSLQIATFSALAICFMVAALLIVLRMTSLYPSTSDQPEGKADHKYIIFTSLAKMAVIMAFFFLADNTDVFAKEPKYFSKTLFWLPLGVLGILGVIYNQKCENDSVLNRDQTNEWKGWMQLVILVYHLTGASKVLPIYMHLRAIVSSYLFLTGYGHFCYVWKDGQITLSRYLHVMSRLNFLTILLCLCMNQPYQNYYYVPLASFWFTIAYIFLALSPRITISNSHSSRQYIYLGVKFSILCAVISILYLRKDIFDAVFSFPLLKRLFTTSNGYLYEWWFRWQLDRYSILYGMVFSSLCMISEKHNLSLDMTAKRNIFLVVFVSVSGLVSFTVFSIYCSNKEECNTIHSYIVFIPIISFVVLRNVFVQVRARYSVFFAWFGRISLELFICQYHIWLANDTRDVLVIVPEYPLVNLILATTIFVFIAHQVHCCTSALFALRTSSRKKEVNSGRRFC